MVGALAWLLAAALGCTTLSTLDGARTLEPGQDAVTVGLGLQAGGNTLSSSLGLPLPRVEVGWRRGLAEDLDVGVRLYLVGAGADLRYRFVHRAPWHLAFAPGVGGLVLPSVAARGGALDLRLPVIAERELGRRWSVAAGPGAVARTAFTTLPAGGDPGRAVRLDVLGGGMARVRWTGRWFAIGAGGDVYADLSRAAPLAWTAGLDLHARTGERP